MAPRKLAFVICVQAAVQLAEERAVRRHVALQPGEHQGLKFDFEGHHASRISTSSPGSAGLVRLEKT
jgi:hypothetical protein